MSLDVPQHHTASSASSELNMELEYGSDEQDPPTVQLDFGGSKGGAWDDRHLIHAYDAALDEFHLHHPGPGSWLDKATAALAVGRPLPGAQANRAAWYTSSAPANLMADPVASASKLPQPHKHGHANSNVGAALDNPYRMSGSSSQRQKGDRHPSPSYTPGSPPAAYTELHGASQQQSNGTTHLGNNVGTGYDDSFRMSDCGPPDVTHQALHARLQAIPTAYIQPTAGVTTEEAMSHAMTAQYWSGYWMGVAQSQLKAPGGQGANASQNQDEPPNAASSADANNVLVTRQRFIRSGPDGVGLKR